MRSHPRSILIDARVNGLRGAHGLARSALKLTAHLGKSDDDLAIAVLTNPRRPQLYPLSELPAHAEVITTDITLGAAHRCLELAGLIKKANAAVMYVPYPTFAPLVRPCPIVVTLHDCTIESNVAFAGNRVRQTWLRTATAKVLTWATAITSPTMASLAEIRRHYPRAPHATLVPNGVDNWQFADVPAAAAAAARHRFGLPEQFILTVGAHRPHKNHQTLVKALARLPEHISLVIIGYFDRGFSDPLPGLIAELGVGSRVMLVPRMPEEWLPAVYRAASVFAFPSLAEGYGMPVLEAMAAGVPVVMSDLPVLREIAGSAALTVPALDVAAWTAAIGQVLGSPGLSASLARAGHAVAAVSTWERGADTLLRLLSDVATGRLAG
jgi:glycosyltransferase involved in cell wall biosynthesis